MRTFQFPEHFLFGTATASVQIEGGDTNNNWYRFCEEKLTKDGTHCIVATDHWNRYEEDIKLMKALHMQTYRMSIEWSRIEPQQGEFSEAALEHYRNELQMLIDYDIRPIVTLHHFSNPIWFEDMGGWANPQSVKCFVRFAKKAVETLGDLVAEWVTINEPNVYLEGTYSSGHFPPKKPNFLNYFKGAKHMIAAHIEAYKTIHSIRTEKAFAGTTLVGVAHHLRVFDRHAESKLAKLPVKLVEHMFHTLFLEGMTYGRMRFPLGVGGYPYGKGVYSDFLGINYYSRDMIRFTWNPLRMFADLKVLEGASVNDLGWEIYPEGLYRICKRFWQIYKLPIYITENGICDATDEKRSKYIYEHLEVISRAIAEGVRIERYYHWSLLDNFEWAEGLTPRFGLIEVNYETLERTIRPSGHFYAAIAKSGGVTDEIYHTQQ